MLTMPKCSGPTFWTRGWKVPRGFWTASGGRARGRRRVRELDIGTASGEGVGHTPILSEGSPNAISLSRNQHTRGHHTISRTICRVALGDYSPRAPTDPYV